MHFWKILGIVPLISTQSLAAEPVVPLPLDNPAFMHPAKPWVSVEDAVQGDAAYTVQEGVTKISPRDQRVCQDSLSTAQDQAQESVELPSVKPEKISPDKPHLIYAVDHRQNGCSMMVMKSIPGGIRPLPDKPATPQLRHKAETD
ncbi:hypothetical protein [Erythrobacter sp. F6033]|uniref:hypothetical protein n=1 Tax=Erythrobacter sp. F6033 TaxID=2926401 RepID=UPI001FF4D8C5|nr:hypothetical protein [Erythrobacter sp. F6033]MCK0128409.1 hypothetical protein [Erythrobacter sp. F6033]